MEFLQKYVIIQQYRYRDIFQFEMALEDPALLDSKILKFVLQPLIENAVVHGFVPQQDFGKILLQIHRHEDNMQAVLVDNGKGMTETQARAALHDSRQEDNSVNRIGLNNVNQRIKEHYGPNYGLQIESRPGQYTKVIVTYPFEL